MVQGRCPSLRRSTTARSSPSATACSASASSVRPRTGSATAASTSACATRASSASAAASRSRAPTSARAHGPHPSPLRSATSGSSRACPRMGYLLDIAPKELEKVLYLAALRSSVGRRRGARRRTSLAREAGREGALRLRRRARERRARGARVLARREKYLAAAPEADGSSTTWTTFGPTRSTSTPPNSPRRSKRQRSKECARQSQRTTSTSRHTRNEDIDAWPSGTSSKRWRSSRSRPTRRRSANSVNASARPTASVSTSAEGWARKRSANCSSRSTSRPNAIELKDQSRTAKARSRPVPSSA